MLRIEYTYWLIAAFLIYVAWRNLRDGQGSRAAFWLLLGLLFAGGDYVLAQQKAENSLPAQGAGAMVIALALLAPRLRRHAHVDSVSAGQRLASALRLGHTLFMPALLIPLVTLVVALFGAHLSVAGHALFATPQMTLTGLALACVIALFAAAYVARAPLPFGLGLHPFFPRMPDVRLQAGATGMWQAAPDHLPTVLQAPPAEADFHQLRPLPVGADINHSFEGWDGQARIVWPDRRLSLSMTADTSRYVLYTPTDFDFFCFEPVDHAINAHNLPGLPQDHGLTILGTGQSMDRRYQFTASRSHA